MTDLTFITGNQSKADFLTKYLGLPVAHHKLDLSEIQSLDLREVVEHKVRQAYAIMQKPVLVEDVSLEFTALGRLPGTFIKFFVDELPLQTVCDLLTGTPGRGATAKCMYGYYDGSDLHFVEASLAGTIAMAPEGDGGFGWDAIFIPEGHTHTNATLNEADYAAFYTAVKPLAALKAFLESK
jgi:inosine triphosphate pyrophosphatase